MQGEQVRLEVTQKKTGISLTALIGDALAGVDLVSGLIATGRFPEIAIYNLQNKRRVLEVVDTDEEADERAEVIAEDWETLELADWCERHDVPMAFFDA